LSHFRGPANGSQELGALAAWGLWYRRAQTLALYAIVVDFLFFVPFLNQNAQNASEVKTGQNSALFGPL